MPDLTRNHCSDEDLEQYSLGRLVRSRDRFEEHLILCPECRGRLERIEPYNFVHDTADGPFYSRITRLRSGTFHARHWSLTLKGGKEYRSRQGARAYLQRSFSEMFPEHVCSRGCGSTKLRGDPN